MKNISQRRALACFLGATAVMAAAAGCTQKQDDTTPLQPEGTPNPKVMVAPGGAAGAGTAPAGPSTGMATRPGGGR